MTFTKVYGPYLHLYIYIHIPYWDYSRIWHMITSLWLNGPFRFAIVHGVVAVATHWLAIVMFSTPLRYYDTAQQH